MDKMKSLFLSSLLVVVSTSGLAQNPIIQTNYTADPAPMVYNDKVYLYTTHDEDNSTWFTMNDWRLYTTSDMVNWTDHGAVLSYTDFSWAMYKSRQFCLTEHRVPKTFPGKNHLYS